MTFKFRQGFLPDIILLAYEKPLHIQKEFPRCILYKRRSAADMLNFYITEV